jgi:hypothetical protein
MANTDLAIKIATTLDATGLNKADKAVNKFSKTVSRLGRNLGLALSTTAIIAFGKASVRAFAADEAAATRLAGAINNLGLSMSNPAISRFITNLEKTSGVADDSLRPAFQALLTTTGDLVQSQTMLRDAIDISRGSGIELTTVAQDLANAFAGNTKGLKKYNLGLTQTQLKTMSVYDIQKKLTGVYSGASAKYLETYAGKMERLSTAAGTAQETIGEGLVNALLILSGNTSAADLATDMQEVADNTKEATENFAIFFKTILSPFVFAGSVVAAFIKKTQPLADLVFEGDPTGFTGRPRPRARRFFAGGQDSVAAGQASRIARKAEQDRLKAIKNNTAELKKQAALKKAAGVFDLEQIGIIAALQGKLSEDDKLRLKAQLALLNGNEVVATALTKQILMAQDQTGNLYKLFLALPDARNPFAYLEGYLDMLAGKASSIFTMNPNQLPPELRPTVPVPTVPVPIVPPTNVQTGAFPRSQPGDFRRAEERSNLTGPMQVVVQIDGKAIASSLQNSSLSGIGSTVNRTGG